MKKLILLLALMVLIIPFSSALSQISIDRTIHWKDADFDNDKDVDYDDLIILSQNYYRNDCIPKNHWCNRTDINRDGLVNLVDLSIFARYYGTNK